MYFNYHGMPWKNALQQSGICSLVKHYDIEKRLVSYLLKDPNKYRLSDRKQYNTSNTEL